MPPKGIFKGATFVLAGRTETGAATLTAAIENLGGTVVPTVTSDATHIISTASEIDGSNAKIAAAKAKSLPILTEGYIEACAAAKTKLPERPFLLVKLARPATGRASTGKPKKKAKVTVTTTDDVKPISGPGLKTAKVMVTTKEPWDCELVRVSPETDIDWFYHFQLLTSAAHRIIYFVRHWGISGSDGQVQVKKCADLAEGERMFKAIFVKRTGCRWKNRDSFTEIDGKYVFVKPDTAKAGADGEGQWEYFLHNEVKGATGVMKIGWHQYDKDANGNMEKLWRQFNGNVRLGVRVLQSSMFWYSIDFENMIQTNQKSGTRRVIRRVAPGTTPSQDAPSVIPSKVAPKTLPTSNAPPDDETEEEPEVDEDETEEEEEAAEGDGAGAAAPAAAPAAHDDDVPPEEAETLRMG